MEMNERGVIAKAFDLCPRMKKMMIAFGGAGD
jgi:hypothetical protein